MTDAQIYAWFISPIVMMVVCLGVYVYADRADRKSEH
jgi:uncharacterized membrane protein